MGFGAVVALILGIILIFIVLRASLVPLYAYVKTQFDTGIFAKPSGDETAVVPGTSKGTVASLPDKTLVGKRAEIQSQLIAELYSCWVNVRREKKN